jgi:hypothetical protein
MPINAKALGKAADTGGNSGNNLPTANQTLQFP